MKRNRIGIFLLTFASGLLLCQNAGAFATWTEEVLNYGTGRLGDTGNGTGYGTPDIGVTVTNGSGSLNGLTNGLVESFGDKLFINPTNWAGNPTGNSPYQTWIATKGAYPPTVATNVYYSFLYKFVDVTTVSNDGMRIVAVNRNGSGIWSTPGSIHWLLEARRSGSTAQLGITKNNTSNGGVTNWSSTTVSSGQTFFVVVRQQIVPGGNDIEDLWINPATNTFGLGEGSVPAVQATVSDVGEDSSTSGPGRFYIMASGQMAEMDEIRIANTWADVTPPAGQCLTAALSQNPSNVITVEGIAASFSVVAQCTGPSYQWQLSQNGGSTWSNIPGGSQPTYTTPILWQATDNGNQYRVVLYVACDNSYKTSSVATVTINLPTSTPSGLVMYDNFSDLLRDNTPVTTNNSVWFTALPSANLDAISGTLIGTPVAGTSTLYMGYFVDESTTNLPVHLDVNKAINAQFTFTPNSFGSHTNNGSLRFGLFDYADGGTLLTADGPLASGSTGNGYNVRGYMLSVDFGTNFTANSPLSLLVRSTLNDNNLMGTTALYTSMGSGPSGGGYTNAPAFAAGQTYTLLFQVKRIATTAVRVTATISGIAYNGMSTNWSFSAVETNFAYHRFDAFGMRNEKLETMADTWNLPYLWVEVVDTAPEILGVSMSSISSSGNDINLSWAPNPAGSFTYSVQYKTNWFETGWHTLQTNITTTTYTVTNALTTNTESFYRVRSP
jgi:hypothetical protein